MDVTFDNGTTIVSGTTTDVPIGSQLRICNGDRAWAGGLVGATFEYRTCISGELSGTVEVRVDRKPDYPLIDSFDIPEPVVEDVAVEPEEEPAKEAPVKRARKK